jgi:hypothetical protein
LKLKFILGGEEEELDSFSCFYSRALCVKSGDYVIVAIFFGVHNVIGTTTAED